MRFYKDHSLLFVEVDMLVLCKFLENLVVVFYYFLSGVSFFRLYEYQNQAWTDYLKQPVELVRFLEELSTWTGFASQQAKKDDNV